MAKALDAKSASKEDIARGLELLNRENERKAKIASGEIKGNVKWADMTDEQKEARREYSRKRNALMAAKVAAFDQAVADGILDPIT